MHAHTIFVALTIAVAATTVSASGERRAKSNEGYSAWYSNAHEQSRFNVAAAAKERKEWGAVVAASNTANAAAAQPRAPVVKPARSARVVKNVYEQDHSDQGATLQAKWARWCHERREMGLPGLSFDEWCVKFNY